MGQREYILLQLAWRTHRRKIRELAAKKEKKRKGFIQQKRGPVMKKEEKGDTFYFRSCPRKLTNFPAWNPMQKLLTECINFSLMIRKYTSPESSTAKRPSPSDSLVAAAAAAAVGLYFRLGRQPKLRSAVYYKCRSLTRSLVSEKDGWILMLGLTISVLSFRRNVCRIVGTVFM